MRMETMKEVLLIIMAVFVIVVAFMLGREEGKHD